MKKKELNQIKRKQSQTLSREMKKIYQSFVAGQKKMTYWKRQRLAISIAYGVPFKYKILRISSAFGRLAGKLSKLNKKSKKESDKILKMPMKEKNA